MTYIIVKKSQAHVNSSFSGWDHPRGKVIRNETHYKEEMKKGGYVSYEEAQQRSKDIQEKKDKERFGLSKPVLSILREVRDSADKKGNVKLSDRQIDAMKKHGLKTGDKIKSKINQMVGGK